MTVMALDGTAVHGLCKIRHSLIDAIRVSSIMHNSVISSFHDVIGRPLQRLPSNNT